jgi:5-methyltetrahydropteroyltriglutamate--homocysteine methyltransferase
MKLSTDRILTTHVGSLPRPPDLLAMLEARETGQGFDDAAFEARLARAVREIVEQQVACGIDSVCDGEQSKISYTFYVRHRLSGIGALHGTEVDKPPQTAQHRDLVDHPDAAARMIQLRGGVSWFAAAAVPCCTGPVAYRDRRPLDTDLKNLAAACATAHPGEAFMNAASPGVLTKFVPDTYYKNEDAYVEALAEALQQEYEAITGAGFVLQIDAPDLGSARHNQYQHLSDAEFLRVAERNIAALNHATRNIAPEQMRLHLCWGNYEGPHHHDVPLSDIIDIVFTARPHAISLEAANPRHAHEYTLFETVKLPAGKVLIPGVIESKSNFIEHPELIAQRIANYARLVGRDNVIAGTDCGYGTWVGQAAVDPDVVWAKLAAMAEGARLASREFWR